ncbi:hypothetical protein Pmani_012359 [Petrolisthes manimaculis]|uniref:Uncharacterized protein n=1 Tax=Petrolisthes manimaculis TaxID=1843537 RepID=A0AAE1UAK5_9EUCA|nr:hypothetical protein Pmani_012359 [Petrolisthes manimaculis]
MVLFGSDYGQPTTVHSSTRLFTPPTPPPLPPRFLYVLNTGTDTWVQGKKQGHRERNRDTGKEAGTQGKKQGHRERNRDTGKETGTEGGAIQQRGSSGGQVEDWEHRSKSKHRGRGLYRKKGS